MRLDQTDARNRTCYIYLDGIPRLSYVALTVVACATALLCTGCGVGSQRRKQRGVGIERHEQWEKDSAKVGLERDELINLSL